ncbi:MAG: DUF3396 domain-containing protein [Vicinamibacteria bacterium]|nr:DUF3396 domain-containing protein [Vicinamibacteria bacterium]
MAPLLRRALEAEAASFLEALARGETNLDWSSIRELAVPALAVTLYFEGPIEDYAAGVESCLASFLADWGGKLTWYADEDLGRFRPATSRRLTRPIERLRRRDKPMPFYAWTMSAGETFESPSALGFQAHVRGGDLAALSFIRASFPREAFTGDAGAGQFVELVARWSAMLPLAHGYAGPALNQSESDGQMRSWILPGISRRFPGFEIDDCGGTALRGREAIKGVNWLTLVGDRFLERLGGIASLRSRLEPAIQIRLIEGRGALFRLGPRPEEGDLARGEDLPLHRALARTFAPIRMVEHPALGPAEYGSFGPEGTARWLRRFD